MNSFLPFLILLLMHGPAVAQSRIGDLNSKAGIHTGSQHQHLLAFLQESTENIEQNEIKGHRSSRSLTKILAPLADLPTTEEKPTVGFCRVGRTRDGPFA